jgi:hypothetical protein
VWCLGLARSLLLSFSAALFLPLDRRGKGFTDLAASYCLKIFIYFITLLLPLNEFRVSLRFMASHVWRRDSTIAFYGKSSPAGVLPRRSETLSDLIFIFSLFHRHRFAF